jgi:FixJ family two-component response regulator
LVPVLVISGYGDIPTAVRAMKAGAVDFIEKPLEKKNLIYMVETILQESACTDPDSGKPLSPAETNVLTLVLGGKTSKEIGKLLHRSKRTVEWHRSHIMHKLKAENMLDLAKRVVALELIDVTARSDLARATETLESGCHCPVHETICTDQRKL